MTIATTLWLLAFAALLGLFLLVRGWRGRRIDDHPLCRKCGYDLHAIVAPATCAECGADLARRGAIHVGHRRRRVPSLLVGLALFAAALSVGGVVGWPIVRDFNFNPYKPLWLLKSHATSKSAARASGAQAELLARLADRRLDDDEVWSIVDESLLIQSDSSAAWDLWRGDFIENAWQIKRIGDDRVLQYLRSAFASGFRLQLPARAEIGTVMQVNVIHGAMKAGSETRFDFDLEWAALKREDGIALWGTEGRRSGSVIGRFNGRRSMEQNVYWAARRYHVTSDAIVRVGVHRNPYAGMTQEEILAIKTRRTMYDVDDEMKRDDSWVMATWPLTLETDFEVVPAGARTPQSAGVAADNGRGAD